MVAEEPRREISAGGTQLLPTPADAAGAGSRSGSGSARRGPARAVPSISTLGTGVGEVHGGFNPRRGAGRGHTKAILAAFLIGGAGVAAAVVKLTAPPASLLGSASRARAEAPPSDPIAAPRPEPPPPAPALAPPPAARAPRKAAQPETVRVRIDSDPTGASLVDARTGDTIGRTPFLRELPRASQPFTLSVRKGSYRSKQVSLDLQHDTELDIKLEHKPAGGAAKPGDDDYRKL
jgi:hypothetical protein